MRGLDDDVVDGDDIIDQEETLDGVNSGGNNLRLTCAFFAFGLLNNVLYVIILSAALDLVPATTPKGIVAFFNIFPALMAKVAWPYISDGRIRYKKRIYSCAVISWTGMVVSLDAFCTDTELIPCCRRLPHSTRSLYDSSGSVSRLSARVSAN